MSAIPAYPPPEESPYVAALRERGIEAAIVGGEDEQPDLDFRALEDELEALDRADLPALVLFDSSSMSRAEARACVQRCGRLKLPVIALVSDQRLTTFDATLPVDDLVVTPLRPDELVLRAVRVLKLPEAEKGELVRVAGLVINPANYEVMVDGRSVNLRFKEYEVLLLMANNPGRVYTREALLEQIWGYDYLGGTRTVDVHVRRLRSKIGDNDHHVIETVWNVGYRFKDVTRNA